jgi:hypothetical protein
MNNGYGNKYNVYGHTKGTSKDDDYLGYVIDSCNQFAREQAKKTFKNHTVTSVVKYTGAFANRA